MRIFELDRSADDRLADVQRVFFSPGHDASIWLDGWSPETKNMQWSARDSVPYAEWGHAGSAPVLAIQGLDDPMATPENGYVLRDQLGADRVAIVDLPDCANANVRPSLSKRRKSRSLVVAIGAFSAIAVAAIMQSVNSLRRRPEILKRRAATSAWAGVKST
jgi:hypothetical protein